MDETYPTKRDAVMAVLRQAEPGEAFDLTIHTDVDCPAAETGECCCAVTEVYHHGHEPGECEADPDLPSTKTLFG